MNYKNKGMFLEEVINNSLFYYQKNQIAFIEKKEVPIKITKTANIGTNVIVKGKLFVKSTVDYIGMYQGKFICFEAKSSEKDLYRYKNIKKHQWDYLELIAKNGGISFFVFYFASDNSFFKVDSLKLLEHKKAHSSISKDKIEELGTKIELEFPGIINIFK
ncbi:Holliday junction resolvase RecU [Mycoplasmopsis gallopavonis]|uniref:Holliday junction resolvase RecU n=1 Tax=Mycoplasmopsis gallopavonis TaxID=76629 RepID=A0A449B037_9BACT|nr:Holliday junction resolvase RecU [Mycoplasmopsis gallopavonis]RIV16261.1 Holliday junction resolvase RecU [Mycoplasmopsis gallopavonis]VEU73132.1 penicillin-binding protein-related factor A recombinase [Mycoplasmopsis gallopavonis]